MPVINKLNEYTSTRPRFVIIGVGGSGCNTIRRMYQEASDLLIMENNGVKLVAVNTDLQSLYLVTQNTTNIHTIQLGTDGLGAGSNPEAGRMAAEHSSQEIQDVMEDADIVIIVAGFGGGTGTGSSPFIAELAKKMGKLVLGFITKPFLFEGIKKLQSAQNGLKLFVEKADTTIILSNQLLFSVTNSNTSLSEAYYVIDKVSIELVKSLVRILKCADLMNLDFADFKRATENMGLGIVGIGEASGPDCGERAVEMALSAPLFEQISDTTNNAQLQGASHILIHIVSEGAPITLSSLEKIVTSLTKCTHKDVSIKVGVTVLDDKSKGTETLLNTFEHKEQSIKILFIATGFQNNIKNEDFANYNQEKYYDLNKQKQQQETFSLNQSLDTNLLHTQFDIKNEEKEDLSSEKQQIKHDNIEIKEEKKKRISMSFFEAIKQRFS